MVLTRMIVALTIALAIGPTVSAQQAELLREQRRVVVGGVAEVWRLQWLGKPKPFCPAEDVEVSVTCPCSGWAYGQAGRLALVRLRQGREIDRMELGGLFGKYDYPTGQAGPGDAYLQLWPKADGDLLRAGDDANFLAAVRRRTPARVIQPTDYDGDGEATEFLIQVGTLPCGKHLYAAVGVSKARPRLHVLGSAAHPDQPLAMPQRAWDALIGAKTAKTVVIWNCDDHGSEVESRLTVSAQKGVIRAVNRDYGCPSAGTAGRLMKTTEW